MSERYNIAKLLSTAKQGFTEIGYSDNLFKEEYSFADIFASQQPLRRVELAVFSREPHSYRNACFGFVSPSDRGDIESVMSCRALGAPQLFSLDWQGEKISHWEVRAQERPMFIESVDFSHLHNMITAHKDEWNPEHIFRAKSIRFMSEPTQLDFFDVGLIPTLEDQVHEKLSKLINNVIASCEMAYKEHNSDDINDKALFRLVFRLVEAKMLADRQYREEWLGYDVQEVIKAVEGFYFQHSSPKPALNDKFVQDIAWQKIRDAFSFCNLSVEALAYVYENTLVDKAKRKQYGIHATPPRIAEYITQLLPFHELDQEERRIFEPFCGHAPFLTASIARLRALLPPQLNADAKQRHEYLVRMLTGMEIDSFACEVALSCLIETDFPNPNGWDIENTNAFTSPNWGKDLSQANIVLCNPPYEAFSQDERKQNNSILYANKAVETLHRVLQNHPKMLGFVLPKVFISGQSYRESRQKIDNLYDSTILIELPDSAFNHSDVETVLLVAHGIKTACPTRHSFLVRKQGYQKFLYTGQPTLDTSPLVNLWNAFSHLPTLESVVDIHNGIQYNIPFQKNKAHLISDIPLAGYTQGLLNVTDDYEPYTARNFTFLNTNPQLMLYKAYKLPWEKPKVIVNVGRKSRGAWTIVAVADEQGLVCYQNFHGIWPKSDYPIEVIAALLNNPVANAFVSSQQTSHHNKIGMLEQIPIPEFDPRQIHLITALVQEYTELRSQWLKEPDRKGYFEKRCRGLIKRIDGEILSAYNLDLSLEQELVAYFDGHKRPGPVDLTGIELSPTKRFYTSLIRVEEVRNEREGKVVDATVINWNPHQTVHLPMTLIPESIQSQLERDTWLLAEVTAGASVADALVFRDIQLAPEVDVEDELA